jgi:fumarate reductase (CoM/CoB) subunit A
MEHINCDVLIIGGGAAGSRAAYEAKRSHPDLDVMMAVAGKYGQSGSSTLIASESLGINAPFNYMNDGDDPDIFYKDILTTGGGLADPKLCRVIADEASVRLEELIKLGMRFDNEDGHPIQRKLSGCTKARSLTCGGSTGLEIVNVLKKANKALGVKIVENVRIVELLKDKTGRVCAARGLRDNCKIVFHFGAAVLSTGGAGRAFRKNINPPTLEGDGWAMAYECGARLVNMEFFQVGPAVMNQGVQFIIHSHMWRFLPKLTNSKGEEFLPRYCPKDVSVGEVIDLKAMSYPFSVRTDAKYLDIAIFKQIMSGNATKNDGIYFDVTHISEEILKNKAPITYKALKQAGLDLTKDKVELGLVVQNFNGGILIDENGFTGVAGLFASGEVTGGVHGSDRPGGNNLTDTQVFGYRAGCAAAGYAEKIVNKYPAECCYARSEMRNADERENEILQDAANLYYRELTIVRTAKGLHKVLDFINENTNSKNSLVLRNRLLVGKILALAALTREESRGTHYREDFPDTSEAWNGRILINRGDNGEPLAVINTVI